MKKEGMKGKKKGDAPTSFLYHPLLSLPSFLLFRVLLLHFTPFLSRVVSLPHFLSYQSLSLYPPASCPLLFRLPRLPSSPPPEGQLNVNALCWVTRLTRMECENEPASGKEKDGRHEKYRFLFRRHHYYSYQ